MIPDSGFVFDDHRLQLSYLGVELLNLLFLLHLQVAHLLLDFCDHCVLKYSKNEVEFNQKQKCLGSEERH